MALDKRIAYWPGRHTRHGFRIIFDHDDDRDHLGAQLQAPAHLEWSQEVHIFCQV